MNIVNAVNHGISYLKVSNLEGLLREVVAKGKLKATTDANDSLDYGIAQIGLRSLK